MCRSPIQPRNGGQNGDSFNSFEKRIVWVDMRNRGEERAGKRGTNLAKCKISERQRASKQAGLFGAL